MTLATKQPKGNQTHKEEHHWKPCECGDNKICTFCGEVRGVDN